MKLEKLNSLFAICQLTKFPGPGNVEAWQSSEVFAVLKTADETTIIVPQAQAPTDGKCEIGFACFRVVEAMEFDVVGVIARISQVLADANIPIFVVSTFETDYVFVKQTYFETASDRLTASGYEWIN